MTVFQMRAAIEISVLRHRRVRGQYANQELDQLYLFFHPIVKLLNATDWGKSIDNYPLRTFCVLLLKRKNQVATI